MLTIIIVLCCQYICCFGNSTEDIQFIDLLQSTEKRDLMRKIARRVSDNVKNYKTAVESSIELTEQQLKEHQESVKKIIEQETAGFKMAQLSRKNINEKSDEIEGSDIDLTQKNGEVLVPLDYVPLNIDFNRRSKRVKRFSDQDSGNEDIQIKRKRRNNAEDKTKTSVEKLVSQESADKKSDTVPQESLDESKTISTEKKTKNSKEDVQTRTINVNEDGTDFIKSNNSENSEINKDVKQLELRSVDNDKIEIKTTEANTPDIETTSAKFQSESTTTAELPIRESKIINVIKNPARIAKTEKDPKSSVDKTTKTRITQIKISPAKNQAVTEINEKVDTKVNNRIIETTTVNIPVLTTPATEHEKTKVLRNRDDIDPRNVDDDPSGLRFISVDQFLKSPDRNSENPYYAPTYNYDPKNAYYNPMNRFGPNPEDVDDKVDETVQTSDETNMNFSPKSLRIFTAYHNMLHDKELHPKMKPPQNKINKWKNKPKSIIFKIPKPVKQVQFDPKLNDYNIDYYPEKRDDEYSYSENIDNEFDSVNSEMLPTNINTALTKNHLNAVRNIFYQSQLLVDKKLHSVANRNRDVIYGSKNPRNPDTSQDSSGPEKSDISLDYFFGMDDKSRKTKKSFVGEATMESKQYHNLKPIKKKKKKHEPRHISLDYYYGGPRKAQIANNKKTLRGDDVSLDYFFGQKSSLAQKAIQRAGIDEDDYGITTNLNKFQISSLTDENTDKYISDVKDWNRNQRKINLKPLQELNPGFVTQRQIKPNFEAFVNIIRDKIDGNENNLQNYNWLGTTVDIQTALDKLIRLTEDYNSGQQVHPLDQILYEYIQQIDGIAQKQEEHLIMEEQAQRLLTKLEIALKNKKVPKNYLDSDESIDLVDLFDEIQFDLDDLHNTIRQISLASNHRSTPEQWYQDLKDLRLGNANRKELLEVLLHLTTVRFLGLLEDSSYGGLESNYEEYVRKNSRHVQRSIDELVFIRQLLKEIKRCLR